MSAQNDFNKVNHAQKKRTKQEKLKGAKVFIYFKTEEKTKVILGKEAFISAKALSDFKTALGRAKKRDVECFYQLLKKVEIKNNGSLNYFFKYKNFKGKEIKWGRNRNMNGLLMIGRNSMIGGRKNNNENIKDTIIREICEECRLDDSIKEMLKNVREKFKKIEVHSNEQYFSVNLDDLKNSEEVKKKLLETDMSTPNYEELWSKTTKKYDFEKRELYCVDINDFAKKFKEIHKEDEKFIETEAPKFAAFFVDKICAKINAPDDNTKRQIIERLTEELKKYQLSRGYPEPHPVAARFANSIQNKEKK